MPYIKKADRNRARVSPKTAGELNFSISATVADYVKRRTEGAGGVEFPLSYELLNEVVGAMQSAKDEFVRRVVVPYEDSKIKQNGDVYYDSMLTKPEAFNYSALRRETMERRIDRRDIQEEVLDLTQRVAPAPMGGQNMRAPTLHQGYMVGCAKVREESGGVGGPDGKRFFADATFRVISGGAYTADALYLDGSPQRPACGVRILPTYGHIDIEFKDLPLAPYGDVLPSVKVKLRAITMAFGRTPRSMQPPRDVVAIADALDAGLPLMEALKAGERAAVAQE